MPLQALADVPLRRVGVIVALLWDTSLRASRWKCQRDAERRGSGVVLLTYTA